MFGSIRDDSSGRMKQNLHLSDANFTSINPQLTKIGLIFFHEQNNKFINCLFVSIWSSWPRWFSLWLLNTIEFLCWTGTQRTRKMLICLMSIILVTNALIRTWWNTVNWEEYISSYIFAYNDDLYIHTIHFFWTKNLCVRYFSRLH